LFLAVSPDLAVSVERISGWSFQARLFTGRPGRTDAADGTLLDRLHPAVFFVLHHARVLFDAMLSGACAADWLRAGAGRGSGSMGNTRGGIGCGGGLRRGCYHPVAGAKHANARRYFGGVESESGALHAVARSHDGPDAQRLRVSAAS